MKLFKISKKCVNVYGKHSVFVRFFGHDDVKVTGTTF